MKTIKLQWHTLLFTFVCLVFVALCSAQEKENKVHFLGEVAPGDSAILFAPNKLNHPEGYHSSLIISNDHKEVYFSPMTRYGEIHKIVDFERSFE